MTFCFSARIIINTFFRLYSMENLDCYSSFIKGNKRYQMVPTVDTESCHTNPSNVEKYSKNSISPSETVFQQLRNNLNSIRCQVLTRLVQQGITRLELIRAFEEV
jgi:hypothetical protein